MRIEIATLAQSSRLQGAWPASILEYPRGFRLGVYAMAADAVCLTIISKRQVRAP